MSRHILDLAGGSQDSEEYTDFVHYRVEECIQNHNSKEETVKLIFGIQPTFTRFLTSKLHEDLPEASTSFKEPDIKPRASRSKVRKAKELQQRPASPIRCFTETRTNNAQISVEQNSSKGRRSKARKKAKQRKHQLHASQQQQQASSPPLTGTNPNTERTQVLSQESIPSADAEIILKQITTSLLLLESIMEQVHKLLSNVLGPPRSAAKQRSWKQVRGDYEQAEMLQDLNQQLQQEMQSLDIPGNLASEEEDT